MTSNFDKHGSSQRRRAISQSSPDQSAPAAALDNLKRDRFELLSAYLDGEVTVSERRQVEQWLETDQNMRCLYSRLLKLRQGMRTMAVPASERSVEQTIESVYKKVDRGPKVVIAWVGAALALLTVPFFAGELQFGYTNSVPETEENTEVLVEPVQPPNDKSPASITDIKINLDTSLVGPAAAGLSTSGQLEEEVREISKDNVMLQLDKSIVPIPEVDEAGPQKGESDSDVTPSTK